MTRSSALSQPAILARDKFRLLAVFAAAVARVGV